MTSSRQPFRAMPAADSWIAANDSHLLKAHGGPRATEPISKLENSELSDPPKGGNAKSTRNVFPSLLGAKREAYGPNGDPRILVAQGASRTFNPTLPQSVVDRAYERDAAAAAAEYGAEFRRDIESFVSVEAVMACVSPCEFERPKEHYQSYDAFTDPLMGKLVPERCNLQNQASAVLYCAT